jgi:hypothetical protein
MTGHGALALSGDAIEARYGDLAISGGAALSVNLEELAPDAGRAAPAFLLEKGRLELQRVVLGVRASERPWHAELSLSDGRLGLSPFSLSGRFDARLLDTRPLVAIFGERNVAVDVFSQLLTVQDVAARGWFDVEPQTLRVRDLAAHGRRMELHADLDLSHRAATGLLYARRGPLSVGVELGPDGREWKLVGARSWFEQRAQARGMRTD